MKRLMSALALSCVLATSTFAGDIPSVGNSLTGEIPTVGSSLTGEIPTSDSVLSDSAMDLIQTFISLLSV